MSEKWVEVKEILSGLIGDLTISVTVLKEYEDQAYIHKPEYKIKRQAIWRLCVYSMVINCCKFLELNKKYGAIFKDLIPEHNDIRGKQVEKIKNNTAITKLRNSCVAHVNNKAKYLTENEVQNEIISMFNGTDAVEFLNWIYPDNVDEIDKTSYLVGVIELLRDSISKKLQ
ncbi:hypothetical protein GLP37_22145 [Photobacterium phosphoreum]|uniref:hypothetical protein n=1 Tax=Photobacterium phosphoreum TaxID=659 RepID=UPI001E479322|nr:hypothetical protein [Photobacterium phosphoreum]MCD9504862.1 hypothetical protein [Photobacterium phosphoreum]